MTQQSEQGAIAALALAVLAVMSILAGAWLRIVAAKVETASLDARDVQARALADAGIERVLGWFADPSSLDATVEVLQPGECRGPSNRGEVFRKRCAGADGLPAFREGDGAREFVGTWEEPSIRVGWDETATLLNQPSGAFVDLSRHPRSVQAEIRVFSPRNVDGVATVVSRATVDRASASVRVELVEGPWRGFADAALASGLGANLIPIRVHWGTVAVASTLDATALLDRLPRRDPLAPITGLPYSTEPGTDRWVGLKASGSIIGIPRDEDGFAAPFEHVQERVPIGPLGLWSYDALKAFAKEQGNYFATRGTGFLYPADGGGVRPSVAVAAHSGTNRLLFIDTLDGESPRDDNLETLELDLDYAETTAYIGAHLRVIPGGGRSVTLDSPPGVDDPDGSPVARGIAIEGVNYRGVLVVAGELSVLGQARVVGALVAQRGVRDAGAIEVWYDAALRRGSRSGFPPVMVKPGSRRVVALGAP
jgi:hypothetical protein